MQETSRYVVGIDVGTTTVRCVVGHIEAATGAPTIVGVGQAKNSGMRKGVVTALQGVSAAIDAALGEAEQMSGYQVGAATISLNGDHILSTRADGMIAVGAANHEVSAEDVRRLEEVATTGKVPPNRDIIEVVPHSFRLDGQDNIKDPTGMTGTRLEIDANVVSALTPHITNLHKAAELANVSARASVPSVLAAAKATLSEAQVESGVAVVDLGAATTGVAVFEEGDLQYVGVVPMGGVNVTNDLAIGLRTDPAVAEAVKLAHGSALPHEADEEVSVEVDGKTYQFSTGTIDEIIDARLDEIFEHVQKELKRAGRAGQLPSGVVLVGGGAQMQGMTEFAKRQLGLAARRGRIHEYGGVTEAVSGPEAAAVIGLMLLDADGGRARVDAAGVKAAHAAKSVVAKLFGMFRG